MEAYSYLQVTYRLPTGYLWRLIATYRLPTGYLWRLIATYRLPMEAYSYLQATYRLPMEAYSYLQATYRLLLLMCLFYIFTQIIVDIINLLFPFQLISFLSDS